ncbi:hypothetical protein ABWJ92_05065 [Streptomyces sp. NPDC000609]|uniref:hypothetical protein n=1 Tax=Streptomyces sp. NPDC000609 TaxID=3160957 RepID=UPI003396C60E
MDPITAAALAALAGSVGSEAGRQTWQALTALVRRPFRHGTAQGAATADGSPEPSSGELEIAALASDPADPLRAQALATALGVRAALDGEFRTDLEEWWQRAQATSGGDVHNTISGGTQNGPVLQGRDFSSLTFNMTRASNTDERG